MIQVGRIREMRRVIMGGFWFGISREGMNRLYDRRQTLTGKKLYECGVCSHRLMGSWGISGKGCGQTDSGPWGFMSLGLDVLRFQGLGIYLKL